MDRNIKKFKELAKEYRIPLWICLIYAVIIFILAETTNWFFGLKPLQNGILRLIQSVNLDLMFEDFVYSIKPYIDQYSGVNIPVFSSLKNWVWLLPFIIYSFITGVVHNILYRISFLFKTFSITSVILGLIKIIALSVPYGVLPVFAYFPDFFSKYCYDIIPIVFACFIFTILGAEFSVFWRHNIQNPDNNPYWQR